MAMTEAPYSVSFTPGRPPIITVRADSAVDWMANLQAAADSGALTMIKGINETLNGQPKASAAAPRPAPAGPGPSENWESTKVAKPAKPAEGQDKQELPAGMGEPACETCGGPTRFDKEGVSQKSGKPYRRYLCTANQLHRATFA